MRHRTINQIVASVFKMSRVAAAVVLFFFLNALSAHAATAVFTNNTAIGAVDTNYDGMDIVVTNCVLTIDGAHEFSSLLVGGGGTLTHSFSANGTVTNILDVTNEDHTLTGTNAVMLLEPEALTNSVEVTDITGAEVYSNGLDYVLTPSGNNYDLARTPASSIPSGSTVLVSYQAPLGPGPAGFNLTIAGNVEVDAGGAINVNGVGYGGGFGPGAGNSAGSPADGSGGGYGGYGGYSSSNAVGGGTFGAFTQPNSLGSGGGSSYAGPGGAGGGQIEIAAGGNLIINGIISANGANATNPRAGGGAGGSVWISGATLSGAGSITANGGNGDAPHGGGGGGGRIALYYSTNNFTGSATAYAGAGANAGGAGTVYTAIPGQDPLLLVDNGGVKGTNTPISITSGSNDVLIRGNANVLGQGSWTVGNVTVASNGVLLANLNGVFTINASGDVTVEPGGIILGDSAGSIGGSGSGAGHSYNDGVYMPCGGGGYGGNGAAASITNATGGASYGSQNQPANLGSGGGTLAPYSFGGAGGGYMQIISPGIIQVDGTLSANGGNGTGSGGGGGSGGTIYLNCSTLIGDGVIAANGGSGANSIGGGGGGGRIELTVQYNVFAGTVSAYGGGGGHWGGAGTVLNQTTGDYQLIIDNDGNNGTNTPLQSQNLGTDLIVQRGAVASAASTLSFVNLYIYSNGWVTPAYAGTPAPPVVLQLSGNATVESGGGVVADLAGYAAANGTGAGHEAAVTTNVYCSGAGHGGYGGNSFGTYAIGGTTYDTLTSPSQAGSGGGTDSPNAIGGPGGGIIHLTVTGTLEVDGVISAAGGAGSGVSGGGGAGGAIYLQVGTLSGAGTIAANGGSGVAGLGGGGAGGLIYIPCTANNFTGAITAYGGGGANFGGAGATEIAVSGKNAQFILDNNGNPAGWTPLPSSSTTDVTVRNGAVGLAPIGTTTLGNVLIQSNAWLEASNTFSYSTITVSSLTIQAGGGISADGAGEPASEGATPGKSLGTSPSYPCSGAGHGGVGGSSVSNLVSGGAATDSPTSPGQIGSGGGQDSPYSFGGAGGGGLSVTVSGVLQLDGMITANGGNGYGSGGGGGSGGGIKLSAGTLAGAGLIRANGGSGAGSIGGGGGGGCIAVNAGINDFSGAMTAYGGGGANNGGPGTIYLQTNAAAGVVTIDNGGIVGPPTPVSFSGASLTLRNTAVGLTGSASLNAVLVTSNASLIMSNGPGYFSTLSCSTLNVQAGGIITGDGTGYPAGQGSGEGGSSSYLSSYPCGGGGHGGYGGASVGNVSPGGRAYDNDLSPTMQGSGGGYYPPYSVGGSGGGDIAISVSGLAQIDGTISAGGGNGGGLGGGGGAGGSIAITGGTLAGAGTIRVNGGSGVAGVGGGGGGGCILLNPAVNNYTGAITAYGGAGANPGGAGTIYMETNNQGPKFIIDSGGVTGPATPLPYGSAIACTLRNGAVGYMGSSSVVLGNLTVGSNASLLFSNGFSGALTVTSATVQAGGGIYADSQGYAALNGPGPGRAVLGQNDTYVCSGGGHGGNGGNSVGNTALGGVSYDFESSPTQAGSGGGSGQTSVGGSGGGVVNISVSGTLEVDGVISANGGNGSGPGGGGGAGGTVYISGGTLAGLGTIRANGGSGVASAGGGGAGGCIALLPKVNNYSGAITAYGGAGAEAGAAGSVYLNVNNQNLQLTFDNGGVAGAATPIQTVGSFAITVRNGASCYQSSVPETFASLFVGSNGWLIANPLSGASSPGMVNLTLTGSATVQAGGGIVTDGQGSAATLGSGAGRLSGGSPYYPCTGGGYGGDGANASGNQGGGGTSYGSMTIPVNLGSGGGGNATYSIGGAGGGAITLSVNGTLDVSGRISANGTNGSGLGGGGGAGGSVNLSAGTLTGAGAITANGGNGADNVGGGGGGGRIALSCTQDNFAGPVKAIGGGGFTYGGAGTIYTKVNARPLQVLVDNGGQAGTNTPISSSLGAPSTPFSLAIANGAMVSPVAGAAFPTLATLTVASNGVLTGAGLNTLGLTVQNNADVEPGGAIVVDGLGYAQGNGTGSGLSGGTGSGAGYGGTGGASSTASGGASYGLASQPGAFGSGGGLGEGSTAGGSSGGGVLLMNVGGVLTVDGRISAEGGAGLQDESGGGSGGSIWIEARTLAGGGTIAADGGAGQLYYGGGGGGGRIALYSPGNVFFGVTSVQGGDGYFDGGAGSVFTSTNYGLQVMSSSPEGIVTNSVSSVILNFNIAPIPATVTAGAVSLTTPNGVLPAGQLAVAELTSTSYQVSFPAQTAVGNYTIQASSSISDLLGQPLSPAYAGTFTISLPVIQGTVSDGNGNPLPGVLLQPSGGLSYTTTDTNGNYSLGFVPGSSFTVTPSLGAFIFLPASMSYSNVTATVVNQNYIGVTSLAPTLAAAGTNSGLTLGWQGLPGVNYQVYASSNLINWLPWGAAIVGSNGPVQVTIATGGAAQQYFSVQASH